MIVICKKRKVILTETEIKDLNLKLKYLKEYGGKFIKYVGDGCEVYSSSNEKVGLIYGNDGMMLKGLILYDNVESKTIDELANMLKNM